MISTSHFLLVNKMAKLVSVLLKEDKHFSQKRSKFHLYHVNMLFSLNANLGLFSFHCVSHKQVTEHVVMLLSFRVLSFRVLSFRVLSFQGLSFQFSWFFTV